MFDRYSVVDLRGPIYGRNWHPPEPGSGLPFRWTGPAELTMLKVPALGARHLRVRWLLAFPPTEEQLEALSLSANGREIPVFWSVSGPKFHFWADLDLTAPTSTLALAVCVPLRPTSYELNDTRRLGLAVSRVEVFALEESLVGEEIRRLKASLDDASEAADRHHHEHIASEARAAELRSTLEAVLQSTSWKITAPIRSLGRALKKR